MFFQSIALHAAPPAPVLTPLSAKELDTRIKRTGAKATIVNLWATWCAPCQEEMPELLSLRSRLAPKGARLILVSGDSPADQQKAAAFLGRLGIDFPVYRISEAPDKFMQKFEPHWPATLPTTMVFDGEGRRIGYWIGRVSIKEVEKRIEKAWARLASPEKIGSDQKSMPRRRNHESKPAAETTGKRK